MIETLLRDYLGAALAVPVFMEIPANPPESYVVLDKTGSGAEDHIFSATVAAQSYGRTLYEAATLNEEVKGLMLYGALPQEISSVKLNSDYNYTDPKSKRYRYQAVYNITHY